MITQILITTLLIFQSVLCLQSNDENSARIFMQNFDKEATEIRNKRTIVAWAYDSNITKENLEARVNVTAEASKWFSSKVHELNKFSWKDFKDFDLRRQFKKCSELGFAVLPEDKIIKLFSIVANMQSIYATAKICSFSDDTKCDLALEPELENIFINSDNPEELKHYWVAWRNASGKKVKQLYKEYVELSNESAVLNNHTDVSEAWLSDYEDDEFRNALKKLWDQLQPYYLQIHAYVRNKLRQKYGEDAFSKDGCIPAHLLGNMWSQSWVNTYKHMVPYPTAKKIDVTKEMISQGYTPEKIFKTAEEFFTSINMTAMPDEFWKKSILEKPNDRAIICHASAWDFYNGSDFRIKQCTRINSIDLFTAHHEMGHVEYFLQYKHLPNTYKRGANPGFHEAVGDVISLSVTTNKHLHKIGLLKDFHDNHETTINKLFETALSKIVFLPYGYIMDLWRWDVFKGKITPENYNSEWWKLRNEYQGIKAPVPRSEDDFDPGAKYHIIGGVPYIRYFVSYIIQFQFHKALCEKAGQYEPNNPDKALHKCDIYQSTEAGNALAKMLQMGSSKPWHDAMESLTGTRSMDASALLEYFAPLHKWLTEENLKSGEHIGWKTC